MLMAAAADYDLRLSCSYIQYSTYWIGLPKESQNSARGNVTAIGNYIDSRPSAPRRELTPGRAETRGRDVFAGKAQ
jgi:hypothetical protein